MPAMLLVLAACQVQLCFSLQTSHVLQLTKDDRDLLIAYTMNNSFTSRDNETQVRHAVGKVYDHFAATFDSQGLQKAYDLHRLGVMARAQKGNHRYIPVGPHCDLAATGPKVMREISGPASSYPGGVLQRMSGFSFGKFISGITSKAEGAAGANVGQEQGLAALALSMGAGLVQSMAASVLSTVPPMIPPPAWNNMPLSCVPMITGHNCFGAVLHPITMADFVIADVTDSMMAGQIAAFPSIYAAKVGRTSDQMYKQCYAAYMTMMCSSIFPKCTTPQSSDDLIPVGGRVPMCFYLCINTLVSCPGFWMDDIQGPCSLISVPPMCTQAYYWKVFTAPPQYEEFSQAKGFPKDCPDAPEIEPAEAKAAMASPIDRAAAELESAVKHPGLNLH